MRPPLCQVRALALLAQQLCVQLAIISTVLASCLNVALHSEMPSVSSPPQWQVHFHGIVHGAEGLTAASLSAQAARRTPQRIIDGILSAIVDYWHTVHNLLSAFMLPLKPCACTLTLHAFLVLSDLQALQRTQSVCSCTDDRDRPVTPCRPPCARTCATTPSRGPMEPSYRPRCRARRTPLVRSPWCISLSGTPMWASPGTRRRT
jgi:hypothetical protein